MQSEEIEIRSLHLIEELEEVRELESKIWGGDDSVPTHQTITAVKNGGLVLGAYINQELIGFQYSFPGFNGTSVYLCSHILATDEQFRNKKIGEKLKLAQREEARKLGYSLITWTYDPLQSVNGYLNIAKLGGVCSTYIENCYGEMDDLLNNGMPSDRFLVEWHINSEGGATSSTHEVELDVLLEKSVIQWEVNEEGLPIPSRTNVLQSEQQETAYVPIPKAFQAIKEADSEAALKWRMVTRDIFLGMFQKGWKVTGFHKNSVQGIPVNFYVLTK
ncbi:GNAT family N-acetyltransferase [Bacillus sp. T33-2]|nr:GNAT family N-acetyltransferase [Bacillus sp. T33-2]